MPTRFDEASPVESANKNPEHAASRSNPHARVAPMRFWMIQDVGGKIRSGVTVATTMQSSSSAAIPRCSSTILIAGIARSLVAPFSKYAAPGFPFVYGSTRRMYQAERIRKIGIVDNIGWHVMPDSGYCCANFRVHSDVVRFKNSLTARRTFR